MATQKLGFPLHHLLAPLRFGCMEARSGKGDHHPATRAPFLHFIINAGLAWAFGTTFPNRTLSAMRSSSQ